jgi:hypothetical protein
MNNIIWKQVQRTMKVLRNINLIRTYQFLKSKKK